MGASTDFPGQTELRFQMPLAEEKRGWAVCGLDNDKPLRVVAAIVEEGGRVLLTKRPDGAPRGGLWELPGGKVEKGESDKAALAREILEELGVRVRVGDLFGSVVHPYDDLTVELVAYRCSITAGTLMALEADKIAWVPLERLTDYDMPQADLPLTRRLMGERGR